ncbi:MULTISPECIES: dihydrodipicolinate synthase family protein [unclassified Mycolicibacterium]|uniref:dihydrodipicolinate synthase family protein n=1 Tax=unclassified Mycolicibacterium TaxID=2636767 RepID=UPI0012DDFA8E|nr:MULTISPECIES: dihydrodipicolinate synthase family protein [unclassified Mycolicibacterium]MUL80948.1 dihydrodipicolinate synthase family protein [Mycolicibacterium sp. CBMA 329]MUL86714.1 dihydrodipicolinate synthase family protein [Mycolicibacterium sp. CBMA 331]MUL98999.1 dihydrodipicolinate synthase family protein [Mycolicibacterium sp. CBMA 334]MUM28872.1 dihydrodipicolinate synthase family protein [Mycolicibacterium sp. CBMA 295]MUM37011.1 dihydrodipicolinate synthase family protein [M
MTANTEIHGILAYPVTPFTEDHQVDMGKLAALVDRLVTSGAHGIVPLGSTGESAYLTEAEFDAVIDTTISVVDRRTPVIIGASDLTTANTIRRAQYAERAGADAVMVLPISYWKLSDREIAQHYAAIGASIGIPIMVYNNPATSGIDMRPELLVQMFNDIDNVTMVKESTGDLSRMIRIAELSNGQLPFYNGNNPLALKAFNAGAKGWCTAAPNLRPQQCLDLYDAIRAGDSSKAESLYEELRPLLEFIVAGGLPTTIKGGLELLGQGVGVPRLPLLPLDDGGRDELRRLLAVS